MREAQVVRYQPDVFGFPDKLLTRIRYCDNFFITSTGGAQGLQVYRWNSTFDPDYTNSGHQPMYRDTYAAIYNHYSVVSARARIQFVNAVTTVPFMIGITTDDSETGFNTSVNAFREENRSKTHLITPLSGSNSSSFFQATWDCYTILNIDPYASETYKTPVGSNPDEVSTLGIAAWTVDASTNSVAFAIELEQTVLWTDLTTPTGS